MVPSDCSIKKLLKVLSKIVIFNLNDKMFIMNLQLFNIEEYGRNIWFAMCYENIIPQAGYLDVEKGNYATNIILQAG